MLLFSSPHTVLSPCDLVAKITFFSSPSKFCNEKMRNLARNNPSEVDIERGKTSHRACPPVSRSGFLHGQEPISTWWIAYIFDIKSLYLQCKEPISSMQKAYIDDAKSHSNASFEQQIQPRFFGHGHSCDHVTILFLAEAI